MAQAFFEYKLSVDSRQYKRELSEATKLANNLASSLSKSLKSQKSSFDSLGQQLSQTKREFTQLGFAAKATASGKFSQNSEAYLARLSQKIAETKGAFKEASQEVKRYEKTLKELTRIDTDQIRRAQVQSDPAAAQKNLDRRRRANVTTAKSIQRISNELREATQEQQRFVRAGLDTTQVDQKVAQLTIRHVRLNEALDRGVSSARRLEQELKDVANSQKLLGSTQFSRPIGPAAPMRGFRGNTGKRAAIGGGISAGFSAAGGASAALTGGMAGLAAVVATKALQAFEDLGRATLQYASDAASAAAETKKLRLALVGTLGAEEAAQGMVTIKEVVKDFNVPFNTATAAFTRFAASAKATGVESDDISQSFKGLIAANKALGGSQEQANGILLAATQVFGKGKVSAEELRGQIGERLPGAVALFAKSMNRTTAQLDKGLEEGVISVEEFVNFSNGLFDQFGADAKKIGDSSAEAGLRLDNNLKELQRNIGMFLQPLGAEFQKVFSEIVGYINAAIVALANFLGVGTEGAIAKTQRTIQRERENFERDRGDLFNDDGTLKEPGKKRKNVRGGGAVTRASQAFNRLQQAEARLKELQGRQKGTIERDEMVTSKDLQKNRASSGRSPADIAKQVQKIESANARRLAEEAARQQRKLAEQTSAIEKRLEKEKQDLVLSGLRGAARAQQQTINAYLTQNTNIEDQLNRLDAAVDEAEMRVAAAQAQVDEAASEADRARAQGNLDREGAKLTGAQALRANFAGNIDDLQANSFQTMLNNSTAAFRERVAALKDETAELKLRNRLQLEGFSPQMIEMQLEQARITQDAAAQEKQFNLLLEQGKISAEEYAEAIKAIRDAANGAKEALEGMNSAQNGATQAIGDYISSATEFVTDTRARVTDMFSAIDGALANSIEGVLTGTMKIRDAFHSFFKSIGQAFLKMAAQMIAKLIIINLLKAAFNAFSGAAVTNTASTADGVFNMIPDFPSFSSPQPFATGGIVTKPTNALIGEGGMNEAVVPLPNGKSIPVDMGKGGASNIQTNITVNVDQGGQADSELSGDNANKLGLAINSAVKRVIIDERRAGGLLYNGRR